MDLNLGKLSCGVLAAGLRNTIAAAKTQPLRRQKYTILNSTILVAADIYADEALGGPTAD